MKFSEAEQKILDFWKKNKIFEKSISQKDKNKVYGFYDGPPFITGVPHYGSLLSSIVKDAVPRYWTMKGYRVTRRWGWDCHGLPAENMVEKKLGIKSKEEIEKKVGIETFCQSCFAETSQIASEWEDIVDRIGRWVEFKGAYKTMDNSYMESVWWAFSQLHKKGLIYEDVRVSLYCPRCSTPLSNFEIAMDNSYQEDTDPSVYIKFPVKGEKNTYFLVWTTTPWTLLANTALAVSKKIEYAKVKIGKEHFWLAKDRLELLKDYKVVEQTMGERLTGLSYTPIFTNEDVKNYRIINADFVSTDEGTGIVHLAPAFGDDDFVARQQYGLDIVLNVDDEGRFTQGQWQDQKVWAANKDIVNWLKDGGVLFKQKMITHSYPHCHRCAEKLIYKAQPAWFVNIAKLKPQLLKANEKINWYPESLKNGRFKKSVQSAPDWNISRTRYWGTPMPVWKCTDCDKTKTMASLDELEKNLPSSNNTFLIMRHGQAENNVKDVINGDINHNHIQLTEKGIDQVKKTVKDLKSKNIDLIFASDFVRTKKTAEIVAGEIGLPKEKIIFDERIREMNAGELEGHSDKEFQEFGSWADKFTKKPKGGETLTEIKARVSGFLEEINKKYQNKNILVISHSAPIWMMFAGAQKLGNQEALALRGDRKHFLQNAQIMPLQIKHWPHNKNFELDLHRPYIDQVELNCKCGGKMKRIPEVFDCWVESGSMPFAQFHYPFENKKEFEASFPTDFVSEYIAQTRAWFYVMHVMGVALFGQAPFRNVLTTGVIAGSDGRKMSKSFGNYTDPYEVLDKYSADALRFYLLSSPLLHAQDINFSEETVRDISRNLLSKIRNSYSFLNLYTKQSEIKTSRPESKDTLDRWIISRLHSTILEVDSLMQSYDLVKATRLIDDFVDDLSNWYIRRSRARLQKPQNATQKKEAVQTLAYVLWELSKLAAPFIPFVTEEIYQNLKTSKDKQSVHLCDYPKADKKLIDPALENKMATVREIVAGALGKRDEKQIKVRQPLASLTIKEKLGQEFLDLIAQEVNVKEVKIGKQFKLDTKITKELQREGDVREIERFYAMLRKEEGLNADDEVSIFATSSDLTSFDNPNDWRAKKVEQFDQNEKYDAVKDVKTSSGIEKIAIKR